MKRTAQATWIGELKSAEGFLTTGSRVVNAVRYSFSTRFEHEAKSKCLVSRLLRTPVTLEARLAPSDDAAAQARG